MPWASHVPALRQRVLAAFLPLGVSALKGRPWGRLFQSYALRSDSRLQSGWPTGVEDAVGPSLKVRIDVIDIRGNIRIIGEALHDRCSVGLAIAYNVTECFDIWETPDQRRGERRTAAIRTVAVIAARMIAPKAVIGPCIDFAVCDFIELAGDGPILKSCPNLERQVALVAKIFGCWYVRP